MLVFFVHEYIIEKTLQLFRLAICRLLTKQHFAVLMAFCFYTLFYRQVHAQANFDFKIVYS